MHMLLKQILQLLLYQKPNLESVLNKLFNYWGCSSFKPMWLLLYLVNTQLHITMWDSHWQKPTIKYTFCAMCHISCCLVILAIENKLYHETEGDYYIFLKWCMFSLHKYINKYVHACMSNINIHNSKLWNFLLTYLKH